MDRKRYTHTDVSVAFSLIMEEVQKARHPHADKWFLIISSNGFAYRLDYTDKNGIHKDIPLGDSPRDATHYLQAIRDGMQIVRELREAWHGTAEGNNDRTTGT